MDRRSWPWKKKSSDKADKAVTVSEVASSLPSANQKQDKYKKPNYVQISLEQYSHLTGLEEQVRTYEEQVKAFEEQVQTCEDQVQAYEEQAQTYEEQAQTYEEQVQKLKDQSKELNEKLSAANAEIMTKDNLVKQHNKVAEDAVAGWERAEAEALALKSQLDSVTLSKLTTEDRAAYLDGALKECMRQIRNLKEEHEQKLQDIVLTKTKQIGKIKIEFEAKLADFEQELFKSAADNDALSRSLQERSNMVVKISEEKSRAEAEIEHLKANIESRDREINSLRYETHVASKELEIRNEERNMSVRSAEAANKQLMEVVKKVAKLEAECQRLRVLVRKKLPGPAALAQMKQEVENLGRDYGDTRFKRSPAKPSSPRKSPKAQTSPVSAFSPDSDQKFQKENEYLTERLLAMEEETKMLKEALAKRNSELQASRNLCAKTASRVQILESQLQQKRPQLPAEVSSGQNASHPPSLTSMSEDGNDDSRSCAESLISESPQTGSDKNLVTISKAESVSHLELMDDFLEMEKMACSSNDTKANSSIDVSLDNQNTDLSNPDSSVEAISGKACKSEKQCDSNGIANPASSNTDLSVQSPKSDADELPAMRLQSRISKVLKSVPKEADVQKIIEDIKCILQEMQDSPNQEKFSDIACNDEGHPGEDGPSAEKNAELSAQDNKVEGETEKVMSEELKTALSQVHEFVLVLGKEVGMVHESSVCERFSKKVEEFSITSNKTLSNEKHLEDFVFDLSHVFWEASELKVNVLGVKCPDVGIHSPDYIDKVALPESNTTENDSSREKYENCNSASNIEVPDDGNVVSGCESSSRTKSITVEEFEELTLEKEKTSRDLAACLENLETTKSQLHETEELLAEVRSHLASAQKSNSLAETQLKCMAESYRLLETRAAELETEVGLLRGKIEGLENELASEKMSHHEAVTRCLELEEQLHRNENDSASNTDDIDLKERELAGAVEKLAECQETIYVLGKQLKALHPQGDSVGSPRSQRSQSSEGFPNDDSGSTAIKNALDTDQTEFDPMNSSEIQRHGAESPNGMVSPKRGHSRSGSSSPSSALTPEKPSRGFSRFFSSKAGN